MPSAKASIRRSVGAIPDRCLRTTGECRLTGPSQPARYDKQSRRQRLRVPARQVEVAARCLLGTALLSRRHFRFVQQKCLHLAADAGAVSRVEVDDLTEVCIAGDLNVAVHEGPGEVAASAVFQVHRKEPHVSGDVQQTDAVAELHAIEDADAVYEADGVRAEVGVDVLDVQLIDAPTQHRGRSSKECFAVAAQYPVLLLRDDAPDIGLPLLDVLLPVVADGPVAVLGDAGAGLSFGVE